MNKYILFVFTFIFSIGLQAQKFSAASQGSFDSTEVVKVMLIDSTEGEYMYDASDDSDDMSVFHLINSSGEKVTLAPDEILRIEISRGEETIPFISLEDEDANEDAKLTFADEQKKRLIFEQVEVTTKYGTPYTGKYKKDSYLLQLISGGMGDFLKVYLAPNFEEGGTEVAPLGELLADLNRNRVDFTAIETYYFIKIGDAPAYRLHAYDYISYSPLTFEKSKGFRRKYSVPRDLPEGRTKKRKKTSRKKVGNKKKKASSLRVDEFPKHVIEFHEFYKVEEAERQAKIKAREEARAARSSQKG